MDKLSVPLDKLSAPLDKLSVPLDKLPVTLDKLSAHLDKLLVPLDKLSVPQLEEIDLAFSLLSQNCDSRRGIWTAEYSMARLQTRIRTQDTNILVLT